MKKLILLLIILCGILGNANSQQRIFYKSFPIRYNTTSFPRGINFLNDSVSHFVTRASEYSIYTVLIDEDGICLVSINNNSGDTIFTKYLHLNASFFTSLSLRNKTYVFATDYFTRNSVKMQVLDINGNTLRDTILPSTRGAETIQRAVEVPGKGIAVLANFYDSLERHNSACVIMLDYNLRLKWRRNIATVSPRLARGYFIEPMLNKHIIFSGFDNFGFIKAEIDTNGNQVGANERLTYNLNPTWGIRSFLVKQTPDKGYIAVVAASNDSKFELIRLDSNFRQLWSRVDTGIFDNAYVQNDYTIFTTAENYLKKYNDTGRVIWRMPLYENGQNFGVWVTGSAYDGRGGVVLCGFKDDTTYNTSVAFVMRYANMGNIFNPADPSTYPTPTEEKVSPPQSITFAPNPAVGSTRIFGLNDYQTVQVHLRSMTGSSLGTQTLGAYEDLDLHHLPTGMYMYTIATPTQVFTGKIIVK